MKKPLTKFQSCAIIKMFQEEQKEVRKMKKNVITIIALIAFVALSAIFYITVQPMVWNNGVHSCGGHWVDNGIVMVGRDHRTVNYLYICEDCGTAWTTPTHY